ncbi:MAG TPA: hypothetical protein VMY34_02480 [Acidimicrobiales bacterium]|nr:hypothetical protein [Acidimicrobiales bacterium]
MRRPIVGLLLAIAVLTTSCSRGGDDVGAKKGKKDHPTATSTTTTSERGAIAPSSLPPTNGCEGTATPKTEATFIVGTKLFAAKVDGTGLRCLAVVGDVEEGAALDWAADATRALVGTRIVAGSEGVAIGGLIGRPIALSDPAGKAVLSITDDGRLMKTGAGVVGAPISFLATTDTAIYHPSGRQIVAAGKAMDGVYGIWIAENDGTEAKRLVATETADKITSLGWTSGGLLTFVALHGTSGHVHFLDLGARTLTSLPDDRREPSGVVPSTFEETKVAVTDGPCGRQTTRIATWPPGESPAKAEHVSLGAVLGKLATTPVGWLDDGTLLLIVRPSGCTGPGSLWAWHPQRREVEIARNVIAAAVRSRLTSPPQTSTVGPGDAPPE